VPTTENPHPTPHVQASARLLPARDRIVSSEMMGGVAFTLLKAGGAGPKSTNQVEIRLASLPKILGIIAQALNFPRGSGRDVRLFLFAAISAHMANSPGTARFVI
jgi:hypothetical protein